MTSTFWIVGECSGKMRSTPWPNDTLRTVKVARVPPRCRPMITPSKIWMRSLSPSRTFTCTRTVSPAFIGGRSASCDFSTTSILLAPIIYSFSSLFLAPRDELAQNLLFLFVQLGVGEEIRPPLERPAHRFALPPSPDLAMMPRQQHVGHFQGRACTVLAGNLGRPRVVRKIEQPAVERL